MACDRLIFGTSTLDGFPASRASLEHSDRAPGAVRVNANGVNERMLLRDDAKAAGVQTLVDLLEYRAQRQPLQVAFRYLQGDGAEKATITYAALQHRARAVAVQ